MVYQGWHKDYFKCSNIMLVFTIYHKKGWDFMRRKSLKVRLALMLSAAMCIGCFSGAISSTANAEIIQEQENMQLVSGDVVEATGDAVEATGDAVDVSGGAVIVTNDAVHAVTIHGTNRKGSMEFVITRDKNTYRFGDTIYLTMKAKYVGSEPITLGCTGSVGSTGAFNVSLQDSAGKRLYGGWYMRKQNGEYISVGDSVPANLELRPIRTGDIFAGVQYIETSYEEGQAEGYYNIEISVSCLGESDRPSYSITVPVYMYQGEASGGSVEAEIVLPSDMPVYEDDIQPLPSQEPPIETISPTDDPIPTESQEPAPNPATGDVDGNGVVDLEDAQLALKAALKIETISEEAQLRTDVVEDKNITLHDAQLILKRALKIEE